MYMYRFYTRARKDYPLPCAEYDKTWGGFTMEGAVKMARNINKHRMHTEIYKIEEVATGETEYL